MSTDPLDKIPEHLMCPICMELPKRKVFQCREGHSLCDTCYSRIPKCPQCRLRFEKKPIRNLFMEQTLDELKFDCPFKNSGCTEKLDRKCLEVHLQWCSQFYELCKGNVHESQNISKFSFCENICKNIGYYDCVFQMNGVNAKELTDHFASAHKALVVDADCFKFEIGNFSKRSGGTRSCIILNRKEEGYAFFIMVMLTNEENKCLIWDAFYWRYQRLNQFNDLQQSPIPFQVKCSLKGSQSLALSVSPTDVLKTGDQTLSTSSTGLTMPAYLFVNETSDTLAAIVKIKKADSSQLT